jgi:hypothetical protein
MDTAKFGSFDDLLDISAPSQHAAMKRLREIILEVDPAACEVVRLGDRAATYGVGPKKMSEGYAYIMPFASWVNLGFYKGTDLPDPEGLLEGTGNKLRHVKIRSLDAVERPAIRALLAAALEERRIALGR